MLLLLCRATRLLQLTDLGLTLLHHVHLLLPFIHVREVLTLADWFDLARAQFRLILKINGAPISIILKLFKVAFIALTNLLRLPYLLSLMRSVSGIGVRLLRSFHGCLRHRELLCEVIAKLDLRLIAIATFRIITCKAHATLSGQLDRVRLLLRLARLADSLQL